MVADHPDPVVGDGVSGPHARDTLDGGGTDDGGPAAWRRLPVHWRRALLGVLALRVGLALASLALGGLLEGVRPVTVEPIGDWPGREAHGPAEEGAGLLGASLERFDALWYLAIAEHGYPDVVDGGAPQAAAFFPGLPLVVRVLDVVTPGGVLVAGSLVAVAAAVAAVAGLHRLAEGRVSGAGAGRRAVLATLTFPTAFFLVAPFTEGPFLAASVWAFVLASERRWGAVAGLGVAAGLVRPVGALLAAPLAIEWLRARRVGGAAAAPWGRGVAAVLGGPAGLLAYAVYGRWRWGSFTAMLDAQANWERAGGNPLAAVLDAARMAVAGLGEFPAGYQALDLFVFGLTVAAIGYAGWRRWWGQAVYAALHLAVWLAAPFPARPLMSLGRFALVVPAIFLAAAALTRRRPWGVTWWATSAALLGLHFLLFLHWLYIF